MRWVDSSVLGAPGRHLGGQSAPTLVLFAERFDSSFSEQHEDPLRHLHAQGRANFSAYSRAELEAAGSERWHSWLRDSRPSAVVLANYDGIDGPDIVNYCYGRGLPVVYHLNCDYQELASQFESTRTRSQLATRRYLMLSGCSVICVSSAPAAELLRAHFPRIPILEPEIDADLERRGQTLLNVATELAVPSLGRRAAGFLKRVSSFASRFGSKVLLRAWAPVQSAGDSAGARRRVLFVANSFLPTLQLCFTRPLQPLTETDEIAWEVLADSQLHRAGRVLSRGRERWARRRIERFRPHLVVFCRYSGPQAELITTWCRARNVPTIYHLDDDLLNVPRELGPEKYAFHNQPARLASVRHLLRATDLVYCSTQPLLARMQRYGIGGRGQAARIHCPGEVLRGPAQHADFKIGYMGIDHAHDFHVALPALVRVLDRNPHVRFELFGPIAKPPELDRFGERVTQVEFVRSYDEFLRKFSTLGWSVGICPLADTVFNQTKANNKWVEYTAVGAAVVATAGMLYDECCADGCGLLAADDGQWEAALQRLIDNPGQRISTVAAAQARLAREYSMDVLREQVQEIFSDLLESRGALNGLDGKVTEMRTSAPDMVRHGQ